MCLFITLQLGRMGWWFEEYVMYGNCVDHQRTTTIHRCKLGYASITGDVQSATDDNQEKDESQTLVLT